MSGMTFKEVGEVLRQERENQRMTLDEVAQRTKISRRHLAALEDGRREDLPHLVYVTGFIKAYAAVLKIDPVCVRLSEEITCSLEEEHHVVGMEPSLDPQVKLPRGRRTSRRSRSTSLAVLAALLLLAGLAGGAWYLYSHKPNLFPWRLKSPAVQTPATVAPAGEPSANATPTQTPPPPEPATVSDSVPAPPAVTPQDTSAPSIMAGAEPVPQANATSPVAPLTPPLVAATTPAGPEPVVIASQEARAAAAKDVNILDIAGRGECWVEARVDQNFTTDFFVRQGERVSVRFVKSLAVTLGNARVVALRYNGRDYPLDSSPGQVVRLTFPVR